MIAHASHKLVLTRCAEQKRDQALKGLRWTLLKGRGQLSESRRDDLDILLVSLKTKCTTRAWKCREDLYEVFNREQINIAPYR